MSDDRHMSGFDEHQHEVGGVLATRTDHLPASNEFDDASGAGLDNARQEEMRPSFLYLLQQSSKAATRGSPEHVPGAEAGMFLITGSRRVLDRVEMVPVGRAMKYLEWNPLQDEKGNTQEGGFVGEHAPESSFVQSLRTPENRFKKIRTQTGTELIQTFELWALVGEPGFTVEQADLVTFPFTSIKIRHYTDWFDHARKIKYQNSLGKLVTPDIYFHRWLISSEFEQKWKPNGAWNVRIDVANLTEATARLPWGDPRRTLPALLRKSDPLRGEAEKLYGMIAAGAVKADYTKADAEGGGRQPGDDGDDGPLPF